MQRHTTTAMVAAAAAIVLAIFAAAQVRDAKAVLPPGNTVAQSDKVMRARSRVRRFPE